MNHSVTLNRKLVLLAGVLERLEYSPLAIDAQQYRSVVNRLSSELAVAAQDGGLQALLQAYPATAELYENLNYQHAGLCRSSLEVAMSGETAARAAIARARTR